MKTWLVIFHSHPEPPADQTFAKVTARSMIHAISEAKREQPPQHPWTLATAFPWPRGCRDTEQAAEKIAASIGR